MYRILTIIVLCAAFLGAQAASRQAAVTHSHGLENIKPTPNAIDPFLAGALGFIPYVSGFYLTETPEKGFVFTLIDVLLTLGIYTSLHSKSGDPDHVPVYYTFMGINNMTDAYFSAQSAMKSAVQSQVALRPHGGVLYTVAWTF